MDIVNFVGNLFILTFLGLMIAFSPLLIMVNMIIVLTNKRPILNALVLIAGVAAPLLLIAILAQAFIDPSDTFSLGSIVEKIQLPALIDILLGVSLLALGLKRAASYKNDGTPPGHIDLQPPTDNLRSLFAFGFFKSLLSATNIFAILFVIKLTKVNNLSPALGLLALFWTIAIGLVPLFMALYYHEFRPERLKQLNRRLNDILSTNIQLIIVIASLSAGAYFLLTGISHI